LLGRKREINKSNDRLSSREKRRDSIFNCPDIHRRD
jgi:hypothetical protein